MSDEIIYKSPVYYSDPFTDARTWQLWERRIEDHLSKELAASARKYMDYRLRDIHRRDHQEHPQPGCQCCREAIEANIDLCKQFKASRLKALEAVEQPAEYMLVLLWDQLSPDDAVWQELLRRRGEFIRAAGAGLRVVPSAAAAQDDLCACGHARRDHGQRSCLAGCPCSGWHVSGH